MRSVVLLAAGLAIAVHAAESPAQACPSRAVTTPEQFAARMRQDYERYGKVIARLGLAVK